MGLARDPQAYVSAAVALDGDVVIGECGVYRVRGDPRACGIQAFVRPERRGGGVATALLRNSIALAKRRGFDLIKCSTPSFCPAAATLVRSSEGSLERIVRHYEIPWSAEPLLLRPGLPRNDEIRVKVVRAHEADDAIVAASLKFGTVIQELYGTGSRGPESVVGPEARRAAHRRALDAGVYRWIATAHACDGECIGVNEYTWDSAVPHVLRHDGIVVLPAFRNTDATQKLIKCARDEIVSAITSISVVRGARQVRSLSRADVLPHRTDSEWFELRWQVAMCSAATRWRL